MVVLPLPDTLEEEVEIVRERVAALGAVAGAAGRARGARRDRAGGHDLPRAARPGSTADGRTTLKSPSATLSTAEAISVMTNGLALAAHFGDGVVARRRRGRRPGRRDRQGPGAGPHRLAGVPRDGRQGPHGVVRPLPRLPRARLTSMTASSRSSGSATTGRARPGRWRDALDELEPDVVLIEGAPELDAVARRWPAHPDLVPPVAGLVYAVDEPRRAAFYPLAVFSPEWVALRWALPHGVDGPLRRPAGRPRSLADARAGGAGGRAGASEPAAAAGRSPDPIGALAAAAGLRRPRALVGGRRRAPRTTAARAVRLVREAMAALRDAERLERPTTRQRAPRGGDAPGPPRRA